MKPCVIFGAGSRGTALLRKLESRFEVMAYFDNNAQLWGNQLSGIPILSPSDIKRYTDDGAEVFVCSELHYLGISKQLEELGIRAPVVSLIGLTYRYVSGALYPERIHQNEKYIKTDKQKLSVLFVQREPCTRTEKIAAVLRERGVQTYLAYTVAPSVARNKAFLKEYPFWTEADLIEFARDSEFDLVHCSNEPDQLVNLMLLSGKKVVHDVHDLASLRGRVDGDERTLEYIANTKADGCLYPSEAIREIALRKFGIAQSKTLVIENLPLRAFSAKKKYEKLSAKDGKLHCVYEGSISDDSSSYRYFWDVWCKAVDAGVHIHFYSRTNIPYCHELARRSPFLHYEGNLLTEALVSEMTKYDCGLAVYKLTHMATRYLSIASPNKIYEYLCSGISVASNVKSLAGFLESRNCGGFLDMDGDIEGQLRGITNAKIPDDFLEAEGLTMDAKADEILEFYERLIAK